jgi:hypothetical protein
MRHFLLYLLPVLMAELFQSCDSCLGVNCKSDKNYTALFRIVRAQDGRDLVFGSNRVYESGKIKFFSVKGGDTRSSYLLARRSRCPRFESDYHPERWRGSMCRTKKILFVREIRSLM